MAGIKTIYNSTGMECLNELLIRELGVVVNPAFIRVDPPVCTRDECSTTLHDIPYEGLSLYFGRAPYRFYKHDLTATLPPDLVYSGDYPCTPDTLYAVLRSTYDWLLESDDLALVTDTGVVPLDDLEMLTQAPDAHNRITLETRDVSRRWVGGKRIYLYIADSVSSVWANLVLSGNAPDATAADTYNYRYTVSGGMAPYRFEVISGTAPAELDPATGQFLDEIRNAGSLSWVVQVTDARGLTVALRDSATINSVPLEILTQTIPDGIVAADYSAPVIARGGALGLRYTLVNNPVYGLSITDAGVLVGQLDAGENTIRVRVTDLIGDFVERDFTLRVNRRTDQQIAQSLLEKTDAWFDFDQNGYGDTTIIQPVYYRPGRNADLTVNGNAQVAEGQTQGHVELVDAHLTGSYDLTDDFAILMDYNSPEEQTGVGMVAKSSASLGWEMRFDANDADVMELNSVIGGQRHTLRTDGSVRRQNNRYHNALMQRTRAHMSAAWNGTVVAMAEAVDGPLQRTGSVQLMVGRRTVDPTARNWKTALRRFVVFRDRVWSDEATYLYNNGENRRYSDVVSDAQ